MMCAWKQLLGILPAWLSGEVDRYGKQELQELRLRLGQAPELNMGRKSLWLERIISREDLSFVVNTASRYSPWAASTLSKGYISAPGGHRIGVCGEAVIKNGVMDGMRHIDSLCLRVARDFPGIAARLVKMKGSILLIGPPGSGKTTQLRDLVRQIGQQETVCVVDERGEIFPEGITRGKRVDVLTGCSKKDGIDMLLRVMGPACIAVDEITSEQDCAALVRAGWCGVRLLATAHAASMDDLYRRPVYQSLLESKLFEHILVLNRDKTCSEGRAAQ